MTSSLTANAVVVWLRCTFLLLYTQSQFFLASVHIEKPSLLLMISAATSLLDIYEHDFKLHLLWTLIISNQIQIQILESKNLHQIWPTISNKSYFVFIKLCSQVIFLNSRQFHVHSPYNNMYVLKLNFRFIYYAL